MKLKNGYKLKSGAKLKQENKQSPLRVRMLAKGSLKRG